MLPVVAQFALDEVKKMLEDDIIERWSSDWCSRPVIVNKASGGKRFCVDYKDLNKVTVDDCYPMTNLNSVLDKLRKAKFITKIDLNSTFMQVNLEKKVANVVRLLYLAGFSNSNECLLDSKKPQRTLRDMLFEPEFDESVFIDMGDLRALQCNGTKLQNCTKIYNIKLYMLPNP